MGTVSIDYAAMAPVLAAALGALAVLVVDLVAPLRLRTTAAFGAALLGAAAALVAALALRGGTRATFCAPPAPLEVGEPCSYAVDPTTAGLLALLSAAALVALLLAVRTARSGELPPGEYGFLLLVLADRRAHPGRRPGLRHPAGRPGDADPAHVRAGRAAPAGPGGRRGGGEVPPRLGDLDRGDPARRRPAYGVTGSLHFGRVAAALAPASDVREPAAHRRARRCWSWPGSPSRWPRCRSTAWAPDVYQGAPVPVAAYLATVSKAGGVVGLLAGHHRRVRTVRRGVGAGPGRARGGLDDRGNLVALRQRRRGPAAGLVVGGAGRLPAGAAGARSAARPDLTREAVTATVGYLVFYVALTVGAFAVRGRRRGDRRAPTSAGWPGGRRWSAARSWSSCSAWPGCRRGWPGCSPRWWCCGRAARRRRLAGRRRRRQHGHRAGLLPAAGRRGRRRPRRAGAAAAAGAVARGRRRRGAGDRRSVLSVALAAGARASLR